MFPRQIRFADIDQLGHVNNVRFFDYLEDARLAMFYLDPIRAGGQPHRGLVVARHEIDYRHPLTFRPDPVRVETWVTSASPVRFTLAYEIRDDDTVYVEARSVMVAYDTANSRPRRLTSSEQTHLARYTL
ncbi:acyl-CoA thioesterase [Acrocarpospora catenulata]|uniref:acyl-CoA thioesterase n=1 Tax=Acrocarpospora catenulata TaxID=2836182 RepID=UPI0027DEE1F1|nr:thioesterase family protein [Acrocarpospora catenulata]